jgi:hypothetical protein
MGIWRNEFAVHEDCDRRWALLPARHDRHGIMQGIPWTNTSTPWVKVKGPPLAYPMRTPENARGYQTAIGFGPGRMFCSTVQESLIQFSAALPTDADTPNVAAGYQEWTAQGFHLTHGFHGWHYGNGVPWGISANIDAFLEAYGHVKPA